MKTSITNSDHSTAETQAYYLLKMGFVLAPLLAGIDKFFNYLTNWLNYLAPVFPELLNVEYSTFMQGVGVIEIMAAIGVALKPRIFGYVVAAWMVGIILNLLMLGAYYDIALRDFGLAIGAIAMARMARDFEPAREQKSRNVYVHAN
jgi:hypothetical protein